MSQQNSFILSTVKDGIQKVVLNRPKKKNALSYPMYKELTSLLKNSIKDEQVSLFVLTGSHDFFTSGNDLGNRMVIDSLDGLNDAVLIVKEFIDALITYPKLLVAIVNGPAIGIGFTILGLFDMVYSSDKAYFHAPFTSLGIVAEGCSTYTFPRLFHSKAGDILYMGYKLSALEAKQFGLVSEVYKHNSLDKVWNYIKLFSKFSSESILTIKQLKNKWDKDILLNINAMELKELKRVLAESFNLYEKLPPFTLEKSKL